MAEEKISITIDESVYTVDKKALIAFILNEGRDVYISANTIKEIALPIMGVTEVELKSKCRKAHLVRARAVLSVLYKKYSRYSLTVIALELNKSHSLVLHYLNNNAQEKSVKDIITKIELKLL